MHAVLGHSNSTSQDGWDAAGLAQDQQRHYHLIDANEIRPVVQFVKAGKQLAQILTAGTSMHCIAMSTKHRSSSVVDTEVVCQGLPLFVRSFKAKGGHDQIKCAAVYDIRSMQVYSEVIYLL